MKKLFIVLALLLTGTAFAGNGVMKFGVLPSNPNSPEGLNVLMRFLSEKTGEKFEVVIMELEPLLRGLAKGDIAFADLSSSAYTAAQNLYKDQIKYVATVAARNEKGDLVPYYKGLFLVLKSSPCSTLQELKGKSFGFVSRESTSGYIYPLATLEEQGIDPNNFFSSITFAGTHEKIFEGLKSGFLDAGVSNYDAFEKAKTQYGNIFKIIYETAEIPSGAFVASNTVPDSIVKKAQSALISVKPTDPVVNYPGFLYKGWVKKEGGFYNYIKKLIGKILN